MISRLIKPLSHFQENALDAQCSEELFTTRTSSLEGKTWLYYAFCCCLQYQHNRRHPNTDMTILRLLLPICSLLLILSLRLVKFPHRYVYIWNSYWSYFKGLSNLSLLGSLTFSSNRWTTQIGPCWTSGDNPRTCRFLALMQELFAQKDRTLK